MAIILRLLRSIPTNAERINSMSNQFINAFNTTIDIFNVIVNGVRELTPIVSTAIINIGPIITGVIGEIEEIYRNQEIINEENHEEHMDCVNEENYQENIGNVNNIISLCMSCKNNKIFQNNLCQACFI